MHPNDESLYNIDYLRKTKTKYKTMKLATFALHLLFASKPKLNETTYETQILIRDLS